MFVPCCFADLCEVESDPTPLRWRVAKVMHRAFGVDPAGLPLETRFMVRYTWMGLGMVKSMALYCRTGYICCAHAICLVLRLFQSWHHARAWLCRLETGVTHMRYLEQCSFTRQPQLCTPAAPQAHKPAMLLYPCWLQIQSICRLVARRSARLAASLLIAVLRLQNWMEVPRRLVVAVDGGVFLKYTNWRKFLRQYLCEAFGG